MGPLSNRLDHPQAAVSKSPERVHSMEYLQFKSSLSEGMDQITLKVSIFDKAGNESNVVVFPFTFESGVKSRI